MIAEKYLILAWRYEYENGFVDTFPWCTLPGDTLDAEMSTWEVLGTYDTREEQLADFNLWRGCRAP